MASAAISAVLGPLGELEKITDRQAMETAQTVASEVDSKLGQIQRDMTIKAGTRRLADAQTAPEELLGEFDKQATEITKDLKGSVVRNAVARRLADRKETLTAFLENHAAKESEALADQNYKAVVSTNRDMAALAARNNDIFTVGKLFDDTIASTADELKRRGLRPDNPAYQDTLRDAGSDMYRTAISGALANGNVKFAEYLKEHGTKNSGITAKDLPFIEDEFKAAARATAEATYERAYNWATANPDKDPALMGSDYKAIKPAQQESLKNVSQDPYMDSADLDLYQEFMRLPPADRSALTPSEYRTKYYQHFDREHRGRADTAYKEAVQSKGKKATEASGFLTESQMVTQALNGLKIKDKAQRREFSRQANDWYEQQREINGKKPTDKEFQEHLDSMTVKVAVRGSGWFGTSGKKMAFQAVARTPDQIPESQRELISQAYQIKHNRIPTDQEITALYNRQIQRGK